MSIDIEDLEDNTPDDYRRANGSPMVKIDGKNERFSRPSSWGKVLDDENALVVWKIQTAMRGMAHDSALCARVAAVKEGDKKTMTEIQEDAIQSGRGNVASQTGTALHAMTDRLEDPDDDFDPPDEYKPALDAYLKARDELGLVTRHIEVKMVNVEYRAAGTADRIYELTKELTAPDGSKLPPGTLVIGDTKTGQKLDFSAPGYTVQMAIYAQGSFYNVRDADLDDGRIETPEINQNWGIIMHMPSGGNVCEMRWCNLELGNHGAWMVSEVRKWRNSWKAGRDGHDVPIIEVPTEPEPPKPKKKAAAKKKAASKKAAAKKVAEVAERLDAAVLFSDDAEWLEAMLPFALARIKTIGQHAEARKKMATHWPKDMPPPSKITEAEHLSRALTFLDAIEAEYGISFPAGDPRGSNTGSSSEQPVITNNTPSKAQAVKAEATS